MHNPFELLQTQKQCETQKRKIHAVHTTFRDTDIHRHDIHRHDQQCQVRHTQPANTAEFLSGSASCPQKRRWPTSKARGKFLGGTQESVLLSHKRNCAHAHHMEQQMRRQVATWPKTTCIMYTRSQVSVHLCLTSCASTQRVLLSQKRLFNMQIDVLFVHMLSTHIHQQRVCIDWCTINRQIAPSL